MKGIFKGFKFISQIFVFKEPDMVIGYPTDAKHVAHIGYSSSSNIPSWMTEFNTTSGFSSGFFGEPKEFSWACNEFDRPKASELSPRSFLNKSYSHAERAPKKKRKKTRIVSTPSSVRSRSSIASTIERAEGAKSEVIMA